MPDVSVCFWLRGRMLGYGGRMSGATPTVTGANDRRDLSPSALRALGVTVTRDDHDRMPMLTRLVAAGLFLAVLLALFGLPPFDLPMPTWSIGLVTPTCGLTRATMALARGELGVAFAFNPAAFVLAATAIAAVVRWVSGRLTRHWVNVSMKPTALGWVSIVILVAIWWINQQLHAELIMNGSV